MVELRFYWNGWATIEKEKQKERHQTFTTPSLSLQL